VDNREGNCWLLRREAVQRSAHGMKEAKSCYDFPLGYEPWYALIVMVLSDPVSRWNRAKKRIRLW
jgi:hypothetical protein